MSTFLVPNDWMRLPRLTCVHPESDLCKDDGVPAGRMFDGGTGDALETVDVQLVGDRLDRAFYMPREKPEQVALLTEHPEVALASGNYICGSVNGHTATSGVYQNRRCMECPHAQACRTSIVLYLHRTGGDGFPRELQLRSSSMIVRTRMLCCDVKRPWVKVHTLAGEAKDNPYGGTSMILRIVATRDATAEEIANAESVISEYVEPFVSSISGESRQLPAAPERKALPLAPATVTGAASSAPTEASDEEFDPFDATADAETVHPLPNPLPPAGEGTRAGAVEAPARPRRREMTTVEVA